MLAEIRQARRLDRADDRTRRALVRAPLEALLRHVVAASPWWRERAALVAPVLEAPDDEAFFARFAALPEATREHLRDDFDALVTDPELTLAAVERFDREHAEGGPGLVTSRDAYAVKKTSGTSGRVVYAVDTLTVQRRVIALLVFRALFRPLWHTRAWTVLLPLARPLRLLWRRLTRPRRRLPTPRVRLPLAERLRVGLRTTFLLFGHRGNRSVYQGAAGPGTPWWARALVNIRLVAHDEAHEPMLDRVHQLDPELLFGLPSRLAWLAQAQVAGRIDLRPRVVFPGGETLTPELAGLFREAWPRATVLNTYGATETKAIATACEECGELHLLEDVVYLELEAPDGGPCRPGEVAARVWATSLWNRTQPVLRYAMADKIERLPDGGCRWRSPRIRVRGRDPAFLWTRHADTGEWLALNGRMLKERLVALEETLGAHGWEVRHPTPGRLEVTLVLADGAPGAREAARAALAEAVDGFALEHGHPTAALLPEVALDVVTVEQWSLRGGKLRSIKSDVPAPDAGAAAYKEPR